MLKHVEQNHLTLFLNKLDWLTIAYCTVFIQPTHKVINPNRPLHLSSHIKVSGLVTSFVLPCPDAINTQECFAVAVLAE